jgi:hypothetical protein
MKNIGERERERERKTEREGEKHLSPQQSRKTE